MIAALVFLFSIHACASISDDDHHQFGPHVSILLIRAVTEECLVSCCETCSVPGIVETVLAHIDADVLDAIHHGCIHPDGAVSSHCVAPLARYICNPKIARCMATAARNRDSISGCLTYTAGTFGRQHEPWIQANATIMYAVLFVLGVAVLWLTVFKIALR